jgi:squalene-associated FAD-dependent desaturase
VRATVVGGGLAGITAALALAERGADVTLLEAKPRLGGATMSFERDGLVIDTGQHIFLGCCTEYRGLLDRLGMAASAALQPRFDVTVLAPATDPRKRRSRLRRSRLPAPLHLAPVVLGYRQLSMAQRARVGRAALAMRGVSPDEPATDEVSLGSWLAAHGQDERARRVLWDLFSVSAINVPGDDASLALAARVVQTGLLGAADAADIGVPALPLGEIHGNAAERKLSALGASVRLNAKVAAIEVAAGAAGGAPARFTVRLGRGSADDGIRADAVVLAVPHGAAARLLPPGALPTQTVAGWAGLGASPIVNVHVIYDRKVMDVPFAVGIDSPVQWIFDRTAISGMHGPGAPGKYPPGAQYLAISLSAADPYVDRSVASLREEFVPALADLLPAARAASVTEFFITRERHATFRGVPGTARLRPGAVTGVTGLVLAGSWTATGWPDTMEGAVRSGLNAVSALGGENSADGTSATTRAVGTVTGVNEVDNSTTSTADSARGVRS